MDVTLQRNVGSENNVFIMTVQFSAFSLASLVSQLTGIDISGIPVIGSLTLNEATMHIANDDPSTLLLDEADEIKEGVTLVTSFSLGSGDPLTYRIHSSRSLHCHHTTAIGTMSRLYACSPAHLQHHFLASMESREHVHSCALK